MFELLHFIIKIFASLKKLCIINKCKKYNVGIRDDIKLSRLNT